MEELERKKLQKDTRPPPSQPGMNHLEKAGKVLVLLGVSGRMSACLPAEDVLAAPVDQRSRLLCLAEGGSKWRATIALLRALLASAKALDAYRIHPITEDTVCAAARDRMASALRVGG